MIKFDMATAQSIIPAILGKKAEKGKGAIF